MAAAGLDLDVGIQRRAESGARRRGSMAAELHPVAMARPLFVLKNERPRGEVLERERATIERERNGGEVGLAGVVSDEAGRRRGT